MRVLKAYKKTVSIVDETAIELYKGLGREHKGFLMESNDKENGRYTFMGVDPEEIIQSDKDSLVITRADGTKDIRYGNPLERLKEYFDEFKIIKDAKELEFMGGLVGSLGYDYIRYTEKLPDDNPDEIGIETIQLMLASRFIAIDHEAETFTAVSCSASMALLFSLMELMASLKRLSESSEGITNASGAPPASINVLRAVSCSALCNL